VIPEYGQYAVPSGATPDPRLQRRRAQAIETDATWVRAHHQIRVWIYWDDSGHEGNWRLTDAASQQAWRAVAAGGCAAAPRIG
jgi:hypothetical protein